jgi:hypothetical protein
MCGDIRALGSVSRWASVGTVRDRLPALSVMEALSIAAPGKAPDLHPSRWGSAAHAVPAIIRHRLDPGGVLR